MAEHEGDVSLQSADVQNMGVVDDAEKEESPEITVDEEVRYWVGFWKDLLKTTTQYNWKWNDVYPSVEIDEESVRQAIESIFEKSKEKFGEQTRIGFIPKGVTLGRIMNYGVGASLGNHDEDIKEDLYKPTEKSDVFGYQNRQRPQEDTLGAKYPAEWEETGDSYMNPFERLVAGTRWFQENGSRLDEEQNGIARGTLCPGFRFSNGEIPLVWDNKLGQKLGGVHPSREGMGGEKYSQKWYGPREVVRRPAEVQPEQNNEN